MKTDVVSPAQVTVALMRGSVATGEVVDAGIGAAVDLRWVQGAAVGADVGATPGAAVEAAVEAAVGAAADTDNEQPLKRLP